MVDFIGFLEPCWEWKLNKKTPQKGFGKKTRKKKASWKRLDHETDRRALSQCGYQHDACTTESLRMSKTGPDPPSLEPGVRPTTSGSDTQERSATTTTKKGAATHRAGPRPFWSEPHDESATPRHASRSHGSRPFRASHDASRRGCTESSWGDCGNALAPCAG